MKKQLLLISLCSMVAVFVLWGCKKPTVIDAPSNYHFTVQNDSCLAPCDVAFTSQVQGEELSYQWEFGDGATSTDKNPIHAYTTAGKYSVNLVVSNKAGSGNTVETVTIRNKPTKCLIQHVSLLSTDRLQDNGNGQDWDNTGVAPSWYPDMEIRITDGLGANVYDTYIQNNISSIDLPFQFATYSYDNPLPNLGSTYQLKAVDVDNSPDMDDLMATFSFRPLDYQPTKPTSVQVTLSDAHFNFVVILLWYD